MRLEQGDVILFPQGDPHVLSSAPGQVGLARLASQLDQDAPDAIIFFGPGDDLMPLLRRFAEAGRAPYVFLPGAWATPDILSSPPVFTKRILLSYPTRPSDQTPEGAREFAALREKYGLPKRYAAAQISAYASAKILVEGLKRSGKDLKQRTVRHHPREGLRL